jgi:hypothetical protein
MKKLLPFAFILFTFEVIAQPTFTATDLNPVVGDVFNSIKADTTGINFGNAGPNQTWNFNLLLNTIIKTDSIISPSQAPGAYLFPTATIVYKNGTNTSNSYTFFRTDNSVQEILGDYNINAGQPSDSLVLSSPLMLSNYPMTYLSSYYDSSSAVLDSSGLFPILIKFRQLQTGDAYGTLNINNQVFNDVLRVEKIDSLFFDFGFFQDLIIKRTYSWFQIGYKTPLISIDIQLDQNSTTISNKTVTVNSDLPLSVLNAIKDNQVNVYPNPAINDLKIINGFKGATTYEIKDLSGKIIVSDQLNIISKTIDIKALSEGMYILELKSNDKVLKKKFVKRA